MLKSQIAQIQKDLAEKGEVIIQARGLSMWPSIEDGQKILIQTAPFHRLYIGDIVLTYSHHCLLCHRIFRIGKNYVQTKADSLIGLDEKVGISDILGKAVILFKDNRTIMLEKFRHRCFGFFYVYFTFIVSPLYPALGLLRRSWKACIKTATKT